MSTAILSACALVLAAWWFWPAARSNESWSDGIQPWSQWEAERNRLDLELQRLEAWPGAESAPMTEFPYSAAEWELLQRLEQAEQRLAD